MDETLQKIEAILFYKAEPVERAELQSVLKISPKELEDTIGLLKEKWKGGVVVVDDGSLLSFMTSSEVSPLIEAMRKEELEKELGRASLETLTIVLYKGPVSRREIDFIRGVQSQYILRSLVSRGLIERMERGGEGPESTRGGYVYKATLELLGLLGIKSASELPEYGALTTDLNNRLADILQEEDTAVINQNE